MKKLKVILAVLFAMLLSCALFACTNSEEENDDTKMVIKSVISVDTIELTDSDGETEYTAKCATISSKWNTNLTGAQRTVTVSGADLTFSGNVTFGTVGSYTVTVTPKENNTGNVSATTTVTISHDFQPVSGQEGVEECAHDGARRTTTAQDVTLHYGTFHAGTAATVPTALGGGQVFTNNSENKTLITDFGTVEMNGKAVTVPTVTAGRLEPGVTITVRGQAKTTYSDWDVEENAYYYFPVVGIADPYLNGSNVGSYDPYPNYTGGTAVMVRGEGWVLYNGIGETSATRTLASLSGGTNDALNYGSHDSDTGDDQPDGYVLGQMPDPSSSDWKNWWVYSKGNTCNSGDQYTDMTDLEITWYYRTDGIIEITYNYDYNNTGNNRVLTSYIKVPEATRGYYQTILHGDYTDITISEIVTIETMTTEGFRYNGMDASGTVYYEGQSFDASAIRAEIKYVQLDNWQTYSVSAADVYATESEVTGESDDTDDVVWVNLADNPMSSAFKSYKIMLVKSQKTWTQYISAGTIEVISNSVGSARGEDDTKIGALTIGTTTSGDNGAILLTLPASENHYVVAGEGGAKVAVIRLLGNGYGQFSTSTEDVTAAADAGTVNLSVSGDGNEVVLTLTLTQAAKVTVSGLQTTDIVLDLTSLTGFTVDSSAEGTVTLNGGGNVTLTYNLASDADIDKVKVSVDGGTILGKSDFDSDWVKEGDALGGGITYVSHSYDETAKVFTLTVKVPAADIVNFTSTTKHIVTLTYDGVAETADTIYYGMEYDEELDGDRGVVLADGMYTFVENGKIYIAISADSDEVESEWLTFPYELTVNVNNGDIENVWLLDLGFETVNGAIAYLKPADLPEGVEISYVVVGTIDDASDIDHGVLVLVSIDVSELGIEGDYAYEVMPEENEQLVYYAVSNNAITVKQGAESLQKAVVTEGNCLETGLAAYEVNDGQGNVVFYLGVSKIAGMHADEDENGVCDLCGGTITSLTAPTTWYSGQYSTKIEDGEIVEFIGTYSDIGSESGNTSAYNAYCIVVEDTGVAQYVMNGHGYYERREWSWGTATYPYADVEGYEGTETTMSSSLITEAHPYNTINGALDGDGNEIDESSFNSAKVGATFRYTLTYLDGLLTARFRMYKEGVDVRSTPYFDFTYTLQITFSSDDLVIFNGSPSITYKNSTLEVVRGKITGSVVDEVSAYTIGESGWIASDAVNFTEPVIENGYVVITANGMAPKATDEIKGSFGNDITHYVALRIGFSQTLVSSMEATVKDANGNTLEDATYILNNVLSVVIPLTGSAGVYTIEFTNNEGSTMQTDIKIDLSGVAVSNMEASVNNQLTLAGGTFTVTYSGDSVTDTMLIDINGTSHAVSELTNAQFGALTVKTVSEDKSTITFEQSALDFTQELSAYVVSLKNENGALLAQNTVGFATLPDSGNYVTIEDGYVIANGTTLTFVFTDGVGKSATKAFTLNVNKGGDPTAEGNTFDYKLIRLYDLSFKVSASGTVSFVERNTLSSAAAAVYSSVNGKDVVAVTVDLTSMSISASDAYGFETAIGDSATGTVIYLVDSSRNMTEHDALETDSVTLVDANCQSDGVSAVAITEDSTVLFYCKPVVIAGGHEFPEAGGLCSVCQEVTGWKVENVKVGSTDNSVGFTTVHGDNMAYNPASTAAYHAIIPGQKIVASGKITASTVNNYNGIAVLLYAGSTFTNGDHIRIDNWVNNGEDGQSQTVAKLGDFNIAKTATLNGSTTDWGTINAIKANGDITVTWDWTDSSKIVVTIQVDGIDQVGTYLQVWTYTAVSGSTLASKYAIGLAPDSGSFTGTITATASKNDVSADDCNPIVHEHSYDSDTDRCPDDGALNPDHVHSYDSTTHLCKCGAIDPNACTHTYENGLCTVCGAVQPWSDDLVSSDGWTSDAKTGTVTGVSWGWYTYSENNTITQGEKLYTLGSVSGDMVETWDSILFEFNPGYTLRIDAYGWQYSEGLVTGYTAAVSVFDPLGSDIWTSDWSVWQAIGKDCDWRIEFDWSGTENIIVKFSATAKSGDYKGYTFVCVHTCPIANGAPTSTLVDIACEDCTITVNGYKKVSSSAVD